MKVVKWILYFLGSLLIAGNMLGLLGNLTRLKNTYASQEYKWGYYFGLCSMAVIGATMIFITYRMDKSQKRKQAREKLLNSLNKMG